MPTANPAIPAIANSPDVQTVLSSKLAQPLVLFPVRLETRFFPLADGNVELRRKGAYAPSDTGVYQGDATGGTITWNSGGSSAVTEEGGSLRIDGLEVDPIESCLVPTLR